MNTPKYDFKEHQAYEVRVILILKEPYKVTPEETIAAEVAEVLCDGFINVAEVSATQINCKTIHFNAAHSSYPEGIVEEAHRLVEQGLGSSKEPESMKKISGELEHGLRAAEERTPEQDTIEMCISIAFGEGLIGEHSYERLKNELESLRNVKLRLETILGLQNG